MKSNIGLVFMMGALAACSQGQTGSNSLGITSVEVQESKTQLDISAYDAQHALIGKATLALGRFMSLEDDAEIDGRKLVVEVQGKQVEHVSTAVAVKLPLPEGAPGEFLTHPEVTTALARWDVAIDEKLTTALAPVGGAASGEVATHSCSYSTSAACAATSCSEGADPWEIYGDCPVDTFRTIETVCCGGPKQAVFRACGAYANSCGTPGPNGCAVCWGSSYSSSCSTSHMTINDSCVDPWDRERGFTWHNPTISYN